MFTVSIKTQHFYLLLMTSLIVNSSSVIISERRCPDSQSEECAVVKPERLLLGVWCLESH